MSKQRVPLGNVPNAANSPFRAVAAAASKRSIDQVEAQEDLSYDFQPRAKRQALEADRLKLLTPPRKQNLQSTEGRVFNKRPTNAPPNDFERKLLAARAREVKPQQTVERQGKASHEALGEIKQWQRYYKKSFPSFVFYFESLPEEVRSKCSKWVRSFGAREEKFFSREVTHVVTTRCVPADSDTKEVTDLITPSSASASSQIVNQPRTINPSLLDRQPEPQGQPIQSKNRSTFEAPPNKRAPLSSFRDVEPRKGNQGNTDILSKAKEMGMKVWQLEKLQRILNTMFDLSNESQSQAGHGPRTRVANTAAKGDREADLSRMLRNERLNGPSDRDATVALDELIPFKGPYIYIRDMDEKTKPIMVREYSRPPRGIAGVWPQFRAVSNGKCPFVDEHTPTQEEIRQVEGREKEEHAREKAEALTAPRTRAATRGDVEAGTTMRAPQKRPLEEAKNGANTIVPPPGGMPTQRFCPPPQVVTAKKGSPIKAGRQVIANTRPRLFGGEPAASGLQPSNVTSAIRSQMISSTAAVPGIKAGTSKEVHGLKRKVLEKNSGPALGSVQTRQRTLDPTGSARAERNIPAARQSRRQAPEPLIHIDEEKTQSEEDEDVWAAEEVRKENKQLEKKTLEKKNLKPGYCENCREKYEDFDVHVVGRKHRKFALTPENWKDLDRLLVHLGRQLKEPDSDGF